MRDLNQHLIFFHFTNQNCGEMWLEHGDEWRKQFSHFFGSIALEFDEKTSRGYILLSFMICSRLLSKYIDSIVMNENTLNQPKYLNII